MQKGQSSRRRVNLLALAGRRLTVHSLRPTIDINMGRRECATAAGIAVLATAAGCASARMILGEPVADECTSAGLKGCPELTEGVLLYVEGKPSEGTAKLEEGARENEPGKLREFAGTIEKVTSLPGISSYTAQVHAVAAILAGSAQEQEAASAKEKAAAVARIAEREKAKRRRALSQVPEETADGVVPVDVDLTDESGGASSRTFLRPSPPPEIQGGTTVPIAETGALPCQVGAPIGATMLCLTVAVGPLILTDLHTGGECRSELFVLAGAPEAPRWALALPAHSPVHVTGARLYARVTEPIAIAVPVSPRADARCAVTWSGAKP
jgi:hypothetical protein